MDAIGLEILERERAADHRVQAKGPARAGQRIGEPHAGQLEACADELARFYTEFEPMLEGVFSAVENHFARGGNWRERRELEGIRYRVRHAHDLTLMEDRLREFSRLAASPSNALPQRCAAFIGQVRRDQAW